MLLFIPLELLLFGYLNFCYNACIPRNTLLEMCASFLLQFQALTWAFILQCLCSPQLTSLTKMLVISSLYVFRSYFSQKLQTHNVKQLW
jgi:hypothetical protein